MEKRNLRQRIVGCLSVAGFRCIPSRVYAILRRCLWERRVRWWTRRFLRTVKTHGEGTRVNGPFYCSGGFNVELGDNVHINEHSYIRGDGGLYIGDNAHFSRNLTIYTVNHEYQGKALPYDENVIRKPVIIEKNVWIGMNVCITPGSHIGEGAIIGMGAVVAGVVPKGAIVGGNPARVLKYRDMTHYERLEKERKYGGVNGRLLEQPASRAASRAQNCAAKDPASSSTVVPGASD